MSKNKPRKARFGFHVLYALIINGLWAGVNALFWQASTVLEVNKPFMVWFVPIGSAFVFAATVLIVVMGVTSLMSDEVVVESTPDESGGDAPVALSVTISQNPSPSNNGVFALGFVAGSVVTALLGRLLRKSR